MQTQIQLPTFVQVQTASLHGALLYNCFIIQTECVYFVYARSASSARLGLKLGGFSGGGEHANSRVAYVACRMGALPRDGERKVA